MNVPETPTRLFRAEATNGRLLYPIDTLIEPSTFAGWLTPVVKHYGADGELIVAVDSRVTVLQYLEQVGPPDIVAYTRTASNPALPEIVAVADWAEFAENLGTDASGELLATFAYEPRLAVATYDTRTIDLTAFEKLQAPPLNPDDLSDPDPTFVWSVDLDSGAAFSAAVPGAITKIRRRLADDVKSALPGVAIREHEAEENGVISGTVKLEFEDHRQFPVVDRQRGRQLTSELSHRFEIPIPERIVAPSKRDAVDKYRALHTGIVAEIAALRARTCEACAGAGVLVTGLD